MLMQHNKQATMRRPEPSFRTEIINVDWAIIAAMPRVAQPEINTQYFENRCLSANESQK
jgi:hypothetical protein